MKRLLLWLPLGLFALFLLAVAWRLSSPADPVIQSRMIGKPVPDFQLPAAVPGHEPIAARDLREGEPRLVNIFASWCLPCIAEAPQLMALARRGIPIDAIAIRDRGEDIAAFLDRHGDPYRRIGSDVDSRVQLSLGSSGVPETFVVDGAGIIRYQHIGELRPEHLPALLEAYEEAR
jgi:cytochrome c biogenesis protein CcmG/thiol:disulfide interchange protein DsbE